MLPGPQPNGLQAKTDGLWIIDQSTGSRVYLVDYADGRMLRSFETDTVRPSGITFDGEALWIGSTLPSSGTTQGRSWRKFS